MQQGSSCFTDYLLLCVKQQINSWLVTSMTQTISDSIVHLQMDRDQSRNVRNLELVEPNRIESGTRYMPALDC